MNPLTWLKQKVNSETSDLTVESADIRVIGDRRSGKTVYMASLAYWPNANPNSPVQTVTPIGDLLASQELIKYAQDVLEQGLELKGTPLKPNVVEVKDYGLQILLKDQFKLSKLGSPSVKLTVNCKDYGGEFFKDLIRGSNDSLLMDYLDDCIRSTGILFLVDGTAYAKDQEYANSLELFFAALDQADLQHKQRRIALSISKCELSQLWTGRDNPRVLMDSLFPKMMGKLETWQSRKLGFVDYFALSSFGTLGKEYPQPNTILKERNRGGTASVIKEPRKWRPFGLVSPIYWLCTGQRHKALDED
jgi:hypothetical protein